MEHSNNNNNSTFSIQDVESHCRANDFWTVIDNVVYDLSGYRDDHPGGVLIMNAAGADATVLFHQYHMWDPEKAQKVLRKFRIGVLKKEDDSSFVSPSMGEFWHVSSQRVVAHLKKEKMERRPFYAKLLWFVDLGTLFLMYCTALTFLILKRDETAPLWLMTVFHLLIISMTTLRVTGQMHANGHSQLWQPKSSACWFAEVFGLFMGLPGMYGFSLPHHDENGRRLLNEPRTISQYELPAGRGFSEHTAVHHVKGVQLEEDQCHLQAAAFGVQRLCGTARYMSVIHRFQATFVFQTALNVLGELVDCTRVSLIPPRLVYVAKHLVPNGEYVRSLAIVIGSCAAPLSSWCYLALPCSGTYGFGFFIMLALLRNYFGMFSLQVFWAQHVWDYPVVSEAEVHRDWGRYNAESSYSWQPSRADQWRHPFLWGSLNGSSPATLTYHLEHTLFPGLNYHLLPHIAPIVRQTCREFGCKYHAFSSTQELLQCRQQKLRLYAHGQPNIILDNTKKRT